MRMESLGSAANLENWQEERQADEVEKIIGEFEIPKGSSSEAAKFKDFATKKMPQGLYTQTHYRPKKVIRGKEEPRRLKTFDTAATDDLFSLEKFYRYIINTHLTN